MVILKRTELRNAVNIELLFIPELLGYQLPFLIDCKLESANKNEKNSHTW